MSDSRPIHTVSGKPQCQRPFTACDDETYLCTRPDEHGTPMHATADRSERASDYLTAR